MSDPTALRRTGCRLLLLGGIATLGGAALGLQPASASELVVEAAPLQTWSFDPGDLELATGDWEGEGATTRTTAPSSAQSAAAMYEWSSDAPGMAPTAVGSPGTHSGASPTGTPEVLVEDTVGGESRGAVQDSVESDSGPRKSSLDGEATVIQQVPASTPEPHAGSYQDDEAELGVPPAEADLALAVGRQAG